MKISTIFSLGFAFAGLTYAVPIDDGSIIVTGLGHTLEKRAQTNAVTGARHGYSGDYRVYRQEINNFVNDRNGLLIDLFLLALQRMYSLNKGNPNSYWEISGIHGRPYQGWNNEAATGNPNSGYCTHGSTLFPTWHRPYLAYIEQVIWNNAEAIVKTVTGSAARKQQWNDALQVLRIPYWDWATNNGRLPSVLQSPTWVFRSLPNGQVNVRGANPLFQATLKSGTYNDRNLFPSAPFYTWPNTLRYPTSTAPNAQSQNSRVDSQLQANGASLRQRVYQLLTNNHAWNTFSNKAGGTNSDSLEAIHDVIHGLTGNGGHMSYVDYSSFDPIFYLHHANIDRLFAIWQALNQHTYVTGQRNGGGTYGVPPNTWEDGNTRLTPFRGLNGQFWTSNSVRDTSTFGYGYYETPKWRFKNNEAGYGAFVRSKVNSLYGSTAASLSTRRVKRDTNNATEDAVIDSVNNGVYYDWRIDVTADKSALDGSYFCHFFLGRPSRNPADWSLQKELVGDYVVFTHTMQAAPGIDPSTIDNTITGTVPLTDALIGAFGEEGLASLQPDDAAPFLIKKLRWRVSLMNDTVVPVRNVRGLKVSVSRALVTLPAEDDPSAFPIYGEYVKVADIIRKIGVDGGAATVGSVTVSSASATEASPSTTSAPSAETTEAAEVATTTSADVEAVATSSEAAAATPTETEAA